MVLYVLQRFTFITFRFRVHYAPNRAHDSASGNKNVFNGNFVQIDVTKINESYYYITSDQGTLDRLFEYLKVERPGA